MNGGKALAYLLLCLNFIRVFLVVIPELFIAAVLVFIGIRCGSRLIWMYGRNKALAIDQWGNAELLGHPDETISSRLGRSIGKERYWWVKVLRVCVDYYALKLFDDKDHSLNAIIPLEQKIFEKSKYELWSWNREGAK